MFQSSGEYNIHQKKNAFLNEYNITITSYTLPNGRAYTCENLEIAQHALQL